MRGGAAGEIAHPAVSMAPGARLRGDCRRADRRIAVGLILLAFAVYNLNFRVIQDGDTVPTRLLPFAIWRSGSVSLDAVAELATVVPPGKPYHDAYWLARRGGHLYSTYPIVAPLLLAPLYAPAVGYLAWAGWEPWRLQNTSLRMEKLIASLVAALSVGLFYVLARRRVERSPALLGAIAYGFATGTWAISSQALWVHGPAELLAVCLLLAATVRQPSIASLGGAGAAAGLAAVNRLPDAVLVVVFVALARRVRWRVLWAVGAAALVAAPFVLYNLDTFGHWAGGYAWAATGSHPFLAFPQLPGVAGLLVSLAKGLLVFSPFFIFLAGRLVPRQHRLPPGATAGVEEARAPFQPAGRAGTGGSAGPLLDLAVLAAFLVQLYVYSRADFRAGACYGPRYLTDSYPVLVWLLLPVIARLRGNWLRAFIVAVAAGVAIEVVGAFCYPRGHSDDLFYPPTLNRLVIAPSVWSPANAPFLVEARAGLAPPELLPPLHRAVKN
jgi:hypothetical protein